MQRRLQRHSILVRLALVAFFIGLNIVLAAIFFAQTQYQPPAALKSLFLKLGLPVASEQPASPYSQREEEFAQQQLLVAINTRRLESDLTPLNDNQQLTTVAQELLARAAAEDYDFTNFDAEQELKTLLEDSGYAYEWADQTTLLGPTTVLGVMEAWESDDLYNDALTNETAQDIGLATHITTTENTGRIGVVVQILAKPRQLRSINPAVSPVPAQQQAITFPEISDQQVLQALNQYRATHGVYPLTENNELCQYAAKRVQDLVAYGGLDGHEGFKKDFEDPENRPVGIKDYRPGRIGENLAYQFCRNMTTGESFIAETGTALIEWCFDSSTLGHREAQLSTVFENVCSRHQNGYFVIIFGE